jgi:hypothetical protein
VTALKNIVTTLATVAFALSISPAYACGGGSCEPPKPPKKVLVSVVITDCDCGGGTCEPPKPPKKALIADGSHCGGGTCEPPKPPKKAYQA